MKRRYVVGTYLLIVSFIIPSLAWHNPVNLPESAEGRNGPMVLQHTPEPGQELLLDEPIEVIFDRAMDRESVERAFGITPTTTGAFDWPDDTTVRFHPSPPFERDTEYAVEIGRGATDPEGTSLTEPYGFRFRTVGYLLVTQVIPAPDSVDLEVNSTFTVMFNRPVVPLTTLAEQADLPHPLTFAPPVSGQGEWLNTSIYLFTPDKSLAGGMTYEARVEAGLTDTTGGILAEDYVWRFTTQPPQVVWLSPDDEQELVPPDTSIIVSFNQAINCASAQESFALYKRGSSEPISGKVSCSGTEFTFEPDQMLEFGTAYEARLDAGITSAAGGRGMVESRTWRFTIAPLPRIIGTTPGHGERAVPPYTSFTIQFNAPIDPDTVMSNLSFTPPIEPSKVYTYYGSWDQSFTVDFGSQPSSDYQVDIGPNIQDPYGNKTGQSMTVRFRTDAIQPQAQLLVPGQISTQNAYDPTKVFVRYINTHKLQFRLYRLDLNETIKARDDWWDYEPPRRSLVRKWTVNVEAPLNESQNVPVSLSERDELLESGVYLLTLSAPKVEENRWGHRHLLVVSPVNLTLKTSREQTLVWATDMNSGQPVQGLPLKLYSYDGILIAEGQTQMDGLASFDLSGTNRSDSYVVGDDPFALVGEDWNEGIYIGSFGYDRGYSQGDLRSHIYTDRPIYRAGQTVNFRGIIRRERDVSYSLPVPENVHVTVRDAAGEEIFSTVLDMDDFGAFDSEIALDPGAALGHYNLRAEYQDASFSASFQVAAYRPPEFQVEVKSQVPEIVAGQPTTATVTVSYFFGGAVVDAPVEWNILAQPFHYQSRQFSRYSFTDVNDPWICFDCWWRPPAPPSPVLNGNGRTDDRGQLVIEIPGNIAQLAGIYTGTGLDDVIGSQTLTTEATTSGPDGSVISGRDTVTVHQGEFYIGLAPQQVVGHAGEEMAVDIITVDWNDLKVPDQPLNVEVHLREWVNTFIEDETGGGRWEWETTDELVVTTPVATGENGEATVAFTPEKGGSYHVVVNGRDETERLVQSSIFVWVSSPETVSWRRENNDRIDLISDKTGYKVGETAEILIPSPFEGEQWALITVERGGILSHEVVKMSNNSYVYRLPIESEHMPNIYVSAVIVKGKDDTNKITNYKLGYTSLDVDIAPVELNLTVTPSLDQAKPGETIDVDVQVTDENGNPVEAELSIDLVDKAVLSLSPRQPNAIVEAFYGRRGLSVETASGLTISLNRLLLEQIEQYANDMDMELKEEGEFAADMAVGRNAMMAAPPAPMGTAPASAMAKSESAAPPPGVALREEFADTAYWNPTVVTDHDGQARVTVKLPDNLTTWVIRGVGVTKDTLVGEDLSDLLVTKPLLIRPVAPRFFVVDDKAQLAALVSNNTPEARDVEVALSSTGLILKDAAQQTIHVEAGAEAQVTWSVEVTDVPFVDLVFSAVSGDYSDAAKPRLTTGPDGTLLVHRYTAPDIVGTGGQLDSAGSRTEVVVLPPRYDDRKGELSVRLDPSLAAGMRDGLTYLEHFPYECSEQIVSKFLPNVLTYRALKELGIHDEELEAELPGLVREALDKLYTRQHDDGGWGWWSKGDSNPQISAYVVFAMNKALETGFEVNGDSLGRGLQYLRGELTAARDIESLSEANLQAYILYVLTDAKGNAGKFSQQVNALYDQRGKLSHYGKAFLAMTIGHANPEDGRIGTLLSDLQNSAILSATGAHWEEEDYDRWAMNTDTRSTAIILDALTMLDPDNQLNPNVVRWLMVARQDGYWESTQETAWALMALTDWMVGTGELRGEYDYRVTFNDEELAAGSVDHTNIQEHVALQVQIADMLKDEANRLTISRGEGPGRLYYTAHLKVYLPVAEIEPANRGISVFREYTAPGCKVGKECAEVNEVQVGDVVQVRLTLVVPHDRYYVIVEDPLPAGAEGIDVSLDTTSMLAEDPALARLPKDGDYYYPYGWWWNWYSRTEMRDDKVVLFADRLPAGTYQYTYTFRAYIPGEYQVIPTVASEMYFPEVFGRSDGRLFTVK